MENLTYRGSVTTEEEAKALCNSLIRGGVYQKIDDVWHVWQIN